MLAILANRFKHAGEERGAHDLVFDGFGVGQHHGEVARVDAVEEFEILVVRALCVGGVGGVRRRGQLKRAHAESRSSWIAENKATHQNEGQHLDPSSLGTQPPNRIRQLVGRERFRHRRSSGERPLEVVEPVRDGSILHDIALVQNVRSIGGHQHVNQILWRNDERILLVDGDERSRLLGCGLIGVVSHFAKEGDDLLAGEGETGTRVDVRGAGDKRTGGDVGREEGARTGGRVGRVDNLDGLDAVRSGSDELAPGGGGAMG